MINYDRQRDRACRISYSACGEPLEDYAAKLPGSRVLTDAYGVSAAAEVGDVQAMAVNLGLHALILEVRSERDVDNAFAILVERRVHAVVVIPDAFVLARRHQLAELAARHRLPTIYPVRDFALSGGLISYGTSTVEGYRLAGNYVARVLKGAKPADLPVQQLTKFELIINLKTARALGLEVPPTLLARADEVIE